MQATNPFPIFLPPVPAHSLHPLQHLMNPTVPLPTNGGPANSLPAQGAQLILLRQTSPTQEKVSRNGLQKNVHVVVKNTPFMLQLALTGPVLMGSTQVDFKSLILDVALLYDSESLKAVSFVKTKPLDFKPIVSERGDQVSLNTKIKVLTSQHEDMFFRVRIRALEPKTRQEFVPPLEVLSNPIKVISKPKQMKKRTPTKKRSVNDMLLETVLRVEEQQKLQKKKLKQLLKQQQSTPQKSDRSQTISGSEKDPTAALDYWSSSSSSSSSSSTSSSSSSLNTPLSNVNNIHPQYPHLAVPQNFEGDEFSMALYQFLVSYSQLKAEEKPAKIRRVMRSCSNNDTEQLGVLLELLISTPSFPENEKEKKEADLSISGCSCVVCPHQQELERIDEFYKDFLATDSLNREFGPLSCGIPLG
jgi:hypothetical protein